MSDSWVSYITLIAAASGALAPLIKALYKLRMKSSCMIGKSNRESLDIAMVRNEIRKASLEDGLGIDKRQMMDSDAKIDLP